MNGFFARYAGRQWTRIASPAEYDRRCRNDDFGPEWGEYYIGSDSFPHRLTEPPGRVYTRGLYASPFGNELLFEFVRRGTKAMKLGQDQAADLLLISLSSNDLVGHAFGPQSHEVMDITLRTDRQLADFFKDLDRSVGLEHCVIALTSDHGACLIPEYAVERKLGGGRLSKSDTSAAINDALTLACGPPSGADGYVAKVTPPWVYLHPAAKQNPQLTPVKLREALAALADKDVRIANIFTADEIQSDGFTSAGDRELRTRVRNCFRAGRSGDLYLHVAPQWYAGGSATGHGSAHSYNTHVPLLLFGRGIKAGRYDQPASPTDIAPTLAKLLTIPPPSKATGRTLDEALTN